MADSYRILSKGAEAEIEEKKSRFICVTFPVESEEDARARIEEVKKKHYDARHNCFAYIIGKKQEIMRYGDDGEPQGTAGRPMLEVLTGENLCNTLAVVTRYFGGTLLGTGGLVRAYTGATQAALAESELTWMKPGIKLHITADYSNMEKIKYFIETKSLTPTNLEYGADVQMDVLSPADLAEEIQKTVTELSGGKASCQIQGEAYYPSADN